MPELPEVEMFRRYFDQTALKQKISDVQITHPKVVGGQEQQLISLVGDQFQKSQRWGKNLFVETSEKKIVLMHFGMTGNLEYYSSSMESPKYARVIFEFDNGFNLAYVSKRMFGRIGLTSSVGAYVDDKSIAVDAMEISKDKFIKVLASKKKNIKTALLDQTVTAGVGNWIADEILYQAKIYPTTPTQNLNEDQLSTIYHSMQDIIGVAIDVEAVREALPLHFITRYGRKTSIECPSCHHTIDRTEVGGRGTYACQHCQVDY
jgi:formamidopyrimidine-DNA glycosylase